MAPSGLHCTVKLRWQILKQLCLSHKIYIMIARGSFIFVFALKHFKGINHNFVLCLGSRPQVQRRRHDQDASKLITSKVNSLLFVWLVIV